MGRRLQQQVLPFEPAKRRRRRGGRAPLLGRKPRVDRLGFVPHVPRAEHDSRHPVHVSIKRTRLAPSLRTDRVFRAIVLQLAAAVSRGERIVHYSVQHDHIHLMVEAEDNKALARGMQLLFSRVAFAVNRIARRSGSLFRDRHHRHELKSPTEVRRALVYVLFNDRKHDLQGGVTADREELLLDQYSSAAWFEAWHPKTRPPPELVTLRRKKDGGQQPTATPKTWLGRTGWLRAGGPIRFNELPAIPAR